MSLPGERRLPLLSPVASDMARTPFSIGPGPLRRPAMSLKPSPIQPVPEATARVARAAFRKGNP
jgi:hypothetical protein